MRSRVIVLAGPSGAGKSRLAQRLGLPVLHLDDFYRSGADDTLPRIEAGANAGLIDWDDSASWNLEHAMAAVHALCHEGRADVPVYSLSQSAVVGNRPLEVGAHRFFVAEGIFAAQIVPVCAEAGVLAAAFCVRQHRIVTFVRRLARDLREHRKPPLVLVRRGMALMRDQRRVVESAVSLGCEPVTGEQGYQAISKLMTETPSRGR